MTGKIEMNRSTTKLCQIRRDVWSHVLLALLLFFAGISSLQTGNDTTLRVFIFAGQSNMVGSDSKVRDIARFPPFAGLEAPQPGVRFSYCLGRENKSTS